MHCIRRRVAPDYVADSYVPISSRGWNAIEKEIGFSTILVDHVSTTDLSHFNHCMDLNHLDTDPPENYGVKLGNSSTMLLILGFQN